MLSKIISHSLFVKQFGFSMFYNDIFFQLAFVLYAQEDFHIICKHILAFYFFLCRKDFKSFHELFRLEVFTCFHFNIQAFLYMTRKIHMCKTKNRLSYCIIYWSNFFFLIIFFKGLRKAFFHVVEIFYFMLLLCFLPCYGNFFLSYFCMKICFKTLY